MIDSPLVSVIIPVKNEVEHLNSLLLSLKQQTYQNIEIIIVDNYSTDGTVEKYSTLVDVFFQIGPERSAQRNAGAKIAKGKFIVFFDADMQITAPVIEECVTEITNGGYKAVVIPERSFGIGFWAKCKALEKECYKGDDLIEAPRFFEKEFFLAIQGYNESLTGFEDWDLSKRVRRNTMVSRVDAEILHDEGHLSLFSTMKKKMYYARDFARYIKLNNVSIAEISPVRMAFFRHRKILWKQPFLAYGMITMKVLEAFAGLVGILSVSFPARK